MRKIYLILCILSFTSVQLFSQQLTLDKSRRCATYEVIEGQRRLYPGGETDQQFETWLNGKINEQKNNPRRLEAVAVLPVVFHIIHNGQAEGTGDNIPVAAIQQQILQLNKDYANLSNSPYGVAANTGIQFALAQNNPAGTPLVQPGIDRIDRNTAGFTAPPYTVGFANPANNYLTSTIKPATIWDPARYLNIWVLQMESSILGIATFPAGSTIPDIAGVSESNTVAGMAVIPTSVGSLFATNGTCNNSFGKGRTLTHEMGHFFGLRHIWGDATCGNDFCGDTPIHLTSNGGVPTHPKSNSCGTADEMFENYMDYTDDLAMNTFTADQTARIQAVLTNSPRRSTLVTSNAGLVPVTATNRIAFALCGGAVTVSETALTGTYPRYRDISIELNVEDKATGNATVTINPTGTAVNNVDYQLLTPSLTFATGDDYKAINIRILDDALFESTETIILNYTISGTGVTAGPAAQTLTISITDNDAVNLTAGPVTLLTQNFSGSVAGWGTLTSPGMPNKFVISTGGDAGNGPGNTCAYISNSASAPFANTYNPSVAGTFVLLTPALSSTGVKDLSLTFKYRVWGETDIDGDYDFGLLTYAPASDPTNLQQVPAANTGPYTNELSPIAGNPTISLPNNIFSNAAFRLGFWWENDNNIGNNPGLNIDDVVLTGTGDGIETAVSTSYRADVQTGAGINNFKSNNTARAIATVTNASQVINGLAAAVTQAGSGNTALVTVSGSYSRANKVITLVPSTPNTSVTYQATFYYTVSELSGWTAGQIPNLKIMKVKDGVNLAGVITPADAEVITPTFSDNSGIGYYSYTATFTGFSQFILVSANVVLPVNLLAFDAKPLSRSIVLNWSTAQEINNKGFGIERSIDGVTYKNIGWMSGQINTDRRSDYGYTDNFVQPGTTYYYRLRQTDIDSREKLSLIRQARIEQSGTLISLSPNPAKDHVAIYISGSSGLADINLLNAQGQVVRSWKKVNAIDAPVNLAINGLAAGIYMVSIQLPQENRMEKLLIK